jgi:hypothetical protein
MRRSLLLLCLLAAGCDRLGAGGNAANDAASAEDPLANLQITDRNADPARIQALLSQAMPFALGKAKDPHYFNVRAGAAGAVCGEVATDGGPPRPFVVTTDAVAVIAAGPKLRFADPSDVAADAYVRWCASPEELAGIQAEIRRAAADPANIAMATVPNASVSAVDAAAAAGLPPPPEAAPEPPAAKPPPPRPGPPTPPGDIDSFMNSVRR